MRRSRRPNSLAELTGARRERTVTAEAPAAQALILGLDPGSRCTGYAVVQVTPASTQYVVSGSIRARGENLAQRLQDIFISVDQLTQQYRPDEVAIESVFMHRNADSALKLGQARGAALSATFSLRPKVYEYAPREVKLAVVGTGAAGKEQVQLMVCRLLNLSGTVAPDAADALAVALCHAYSRRMRAMASILAGAAR